MQSGRREAAGQLALEDAAQQGPEDGDGEQAGNAGHGIVDSGGGAGIALRHGVHHGSGQRGDADRHTQAQQRGRRGRRWTSRTADARDGECAEPGGCDEGSGYQRDPRTKAVDEAAGPAGQQEHEQDKREQGGAGLSGRISLDLDQVQGKKNMMPLKPE